ncbi:hypothetical protein [Kitasatospora purpeofusca]|uniref:Uncharacterized protein n=1 Tax=Kitasatospora purpeofusca TaxID=67352 RepID=A0ABZ1UBI1_9ACTN|nr:hypothetical protein [Kitasatospora purpeofusca]
MVTVVAAVAEDECDHRRPEGGTDELGADEAGYRGGGEAEQVASL